MKSKVERTVSISMTETEATMLMAIVQNPFHAQTPLNEDPIERRLREDLFHTLKGALYPSGDFGHRAYAIDCNS